VSPSQEYVEYAEGLSVNHEEGSKELWVVVRRNPASKYLHALFEFFCSSATSAPVECILSTSGLFMRPHRACMGNKLLSELVMIKANLH